MGFRFPDPRHDFASLLIASGLDVKTVQSRLRHPSAKTTLDTSGHLWPSATSQARPPSRRSSPSVRPAKVVSVEELLPLEGELRAGESTDDLILLLRGGEDTRGKVLKHAAALQGRFTYGGIPARGISLFAARGDLDARLVLGAKLASYRRYYRLSGPAVAAVGLLLPTFRSPHWTLLFRVPPGGQPRAEGEIVDELLDLLGPLLDNPKYEPRHGHRR